MSRHSLTLSLLHLAPLLPLSSALTEQEDSADSTGLPSSLHECYHLSGPRWQWTVNSENVGQGVTDNHTGGPKTQMPLGPVTCFRHQGLVGMWGTTGHMPHLWATPPTVQPAEYRAQLVFPEKLGILVFL